MAKIQLVIVTPEKTTFEEMVDSVTLPLVDGEAGILANHAPMIGRLGPGELRAVRGSTIDRFFVDGGFAQVENNSVTVLPGQSIPSSEIDLAAAKAELEEANAQSGIKPELAAIKAKAVAKAQAKIRIASAR